MLCFRARGNRLPQQLTWSLGETTVPCKASYNHLGIVINTKYSTSDKITHACKKGRKPYFATSNMLKSLANALTLSHLYTIAVRSSVLYGCELLKKMSQQDKYCFRLCTCQPFVCKIHWAFQQGQGQTWHRVCLTFSHCWQKSIPESSSFLEIMLPWRALVPQKRYFGKALLLYWMPE